MRRLYVGQIGAEMKLGAGQAHYLRDVLRLAEGEALEVFDGRGGAWEARIVRLGADGVVLALGAPRQVEPPAAHIVLVQGISRGEKMDLVVQKATELGVARIAPAACARSV